jgi:hypothetical protein
VCRRMCTPSCDSFARRDARSTRYCTICRVNGWPSSWHSTLTVNFVGWCQPTAAALRARRVIARRGRMRMLSGEPQSIRTRSEESGEGGVPPSVKVDARPGRGTRHSAIAPGSLASVRRATAVNIIDAWQVIATPSERYPGRHAIRIVRRLARPRGKDGWVVANSPATT